jgi:hypothetical protein
VTALSYGLPTEHGNEEARSRFLAPVSPPRRIHILSLIVAFDQIFLRICYLFKRQLKNVPESIIPGRIGTKGRIEYHYILLGIVNVVFVEMKLKLGSELERLNAIAQVIAEADGAHFITLGIFFTHLATPGCDLANAYRNIQIPVLCIFYDGSVFQFFRYNHDDPQPFARGCLTTPTPSGVLETSTSVGIADPILANSRAFVLSLRPACEIIYYCFLSAFVNGLRGMATNPEHANLAHAVQLAEEARRLAVEAADHAKDGKLEIASAGADSAVKKIEERFVTVLLEVIESYVSPAFLRFRRLSANHLRFWDGAIRMKLSVHKASSFDVILSYFLVIFFSHVYPITFCLKSWWSYCMFPVIRCLITWLGSARASELVNYR